MSTQTDIEDLYHDFGDRVSVVDVVTHEPHEKRPQELIEVRFDPDGFILSIPHSGVLVPAQYADRFPLDETSLVEIDLYSEMIYAPLEGCQVISHLAPFFVDMNRSLNGSDDPDAPYHLTNPPQHYYTVEDELILQRAYTDTEREDVLRYYHLYHGLLERLIERMKAERGYALLIDGHSMTGEGQGRAYDKGERRDNFVVGTLEGASAHAAIIDAFAGGLKDSVAQHDLDLTVAKDVPYSGGFITRRHSDPANDVHALQVEVTMETYMYEAVDDDVAKRYALKPPRVRIVQDALRRAIHGARAAAERIYR